MSFSTRALASLVSALLLCLGAMGCDSRSDDDDVAAPDDDDASNDVELENLSAVVSASGSCSPNNDGDLVDCAHYVLTLTMANHTSTALERIRSFEVRADDMRFSSGLDECESPLWLPGPGESSPVLDVELDPWASGSFARLVIEDCGYSVDEINDDMPLDGDLEFTVEGLFADGAVWTARAEADIEDLSD